MVMKHNVMKWILLMLIFSGFSMPVFSVSVSGTVTDAQTGDGIAGATVIAVGHGYTNDAYLSFSTYTNADGFYAFDSLIAGRYFILATAENYTHQSLGPLELDPNIVIDGLNFVLVPENGGGPAWLSGFVFDARNQQTVHPAFIHLYGYTAAGDSLSFFAETYPDGSYKFPHLMPGIYSIFIEAPGYEPQGIADLPIEPGQNYHDFFLEPFIFPEFGAITGKVFFDSSHAPVTEGFLEFIPALDVPIEPWATHINADGQYEIELPAGDYFVICRVPVGPQLPAFYEEYYDDVQLPEEATLVSVRPDEVTSGIDFGIPDNFGGGNAAHLYGFVYEADPTIDMLKPVHPAFIELFRLDSATGDSAFFHIINNDDGSYEIPHLPAGFYHIICHAEGFEPVEFHEYYIAPGGNYLDFFLTPLVTGPKGYITGNVFFDGTDAFQPVAGAILEFISPDGISRHPVRSNNTGHYEAELPVGEYIVSCTVIEYFPFAPPYMYREYYNDAQSITEATVVRVVENHVTGNIDFGIPDVVPPNFTVITGQVTSADGAPLTEALVTIRPHLDFPNDSLYYRAFTNADGFYEVTVTSNLQPFNVFIASAEKEGYLIEFWHEQPAIHLADPIHVFGDSVISDINFTLDPDFAPAHSISGSVFSESGDVLTAFVVASHLQSGRISFSFSDPNGQYFLGGLEEGLHIILFAADGHIPEFYDDALLWENATPVFAAGAVRGIDALLTPFSINSNGGVIAGTVTEPGGNVLSGVLMSITDADGRVLGYDFSDGQGNYQINGVSSGNLTVQASKVSFNSETSDVLFNGGPSSTMLVNFDLEQTVVSIDPKDTGSAVPQSFDLAQNFPNPFNPETTISFALPEAGHTRLTIYNLLGQEIQQLVNQVMPAGSHQLVWNGRDSRGQKVVSGIYLYSLEAGSVRLTKKMLLSK